MEGRRRGRGRGRGGGRGGVTRVRVATGAGAGVGTRTKEEVTLGSQPNHERGRIEDVGKGVTPTGSQQLQPQTLMPERARRIIMGIRYQGRHRRAQNRDWRRGAVKVASRRYFQHPHFISIVGVGKRGEY